MRNFKILDLDFIKLLFIYVNLNLLIKNKIYIKIFLYENNT